MCYASQATGPGGGVRFWDALAPLRPSGAKLAQDARKHRGPRKALNPDILPPPCRRGRSNDTDMCKMQQ